MGADDGDRDARAFRDEYNPTADTLRPSMSPLEAELAIAKSTCAGQLLELARMQAVIDEMRAALRDANADRRWLGRRVQQLEHRNKELESSKKGPP